MARSLTILVGGTFNPVHLGHTYIASHAYERLEADACWLMPCKPIHRYCDKVLSQKHRLAMVQLAIAAYPYMQVQTYELEQKKLSITLDTLKSLRKLYPDRDFAYVMGQDVMCGIQGWDDWPELLDYAHLVVVNRVMKVNELAVPLIGSVPKRWHEVCTYDAQNLKKKHHGQIFLLKLNPLVVCATNIRQDVIRVGYDAHCLDKQVYDYITAHKLYTAP
jgi:nicotinate-nucleotide adenylyltransferase